MPRTTTEPQADTLTFRIAPALKADLAALAQREAKPIGKFLRELIRERIEQEERRQFKEQVRRDCDVINAAARDPNSDEAQLLRELDVYADSLADEWKWQE